MTVEVVRCVSPSAEVPAPEPREGGLRLVNESALGVYVVSWVGSDGARREVSWAAGLDGPLAGTTAGGRVVTRPIAEPERFGWGRPQRMADFMAFARRFADALERP